VFEYLRLSKLGWFTDSDQGWHGHAPLTMIAVIALGLVAAYFVLKRN
jgi:F0F1-type ATP synthase assembly protein I